MIAPRYWAHGRQWPRDAQVEYDVTSSEYEAIAADRNIVSIVILDTQEQTSKTKGK
jgi:hypothetical protein